MRNNNQGLHSDERASLSLFQQGTRDSGCALQSVWTSGRLNFESLAYFCVMMNMYTADKMIRLAEILLQILEQ